MLTEDYFVETEDYFIETEDQKYWRMTTLLKRKTKNTDGGLLYWNGGSKILTEDYFVETEL